MVINHNPELELQVKAAVRQHSSLRSIVERYLIGWLLDEQQRKRGGYGQAVVASLAREHAFGLGSVAAVYFHLMLYHRWPLKLAVTADKAGLTWPAVINLLSYEPSPVEARLAPADAELRHNLDQRRSKRDWFITSARDKKFSGKRLIDEIVRWKKQTSTLWPETKRRHLCVVQQDTLVRDIGRMKEKVELYQDTLVDVGDVQIDQPKQVTKLMYVIDQLGN